MDNASTIAKVGIPNALASMAVFQLVLPNQLEVRDVNGPTPERWTGEATQSSWTPRVPNSQPE